VAKLIILHAGFHDDSYVIWGEQESEPFEVCNQVERTRETAATTESPLPNKRVKPSAALATHSKPSSSGKNKRVQAEKAYSDTVKLLAANGANRKKKAGKSSSEKIHEHPYALGYRDLIDTINTITMANTANTIFDTSGIAVDASVTGADARRLSIWLPSNCKSPISSDSTYRQPCQGLDAANDRMVKLWAVNAVAMEGAQFVAFLEQTQGRQILKSGVHLSDEFDFFFRMLQFSASLVVRQQYLPTVKGRGRSLVACWDPVLTGDDHSRLIQVSAQLPYVSRAVYPGSLAEQKQDDYPRRQPLALPRVETTIAIIQGLVDGIVKRAIQKNEQEQNARGERAQDAKSEQERHPHTDTFESRYARRRRSPFEASAEKIFSGPAPGQQRGQDTDQQKNKSAHDFVSVHECWLAALRTPPGKLNYDRTQLSKFIGELTDWQMPATAFNAAPFRLCFHLEEPNYVYEKMEFISEEALTAKWTVHYLLQSTIDPSLLIPAAQSWRNSLDMRIAFADNQFRTREYLLLSLAKAANISPSILESLSDQNPTGFQLDNHSAFKFLTETVPLLEEAGFALLLPKWWTDRGRKRLKLTGTGFRPAGAAGSGEGNEGFSAEARFSLQSLMKFDWRISIGDVPLTVQELEALASLKSPLVNIRGVWVHVSAKDIQAIIQFIKSKGGVTASLQEIIRYSIGAATPIESTADISVDIKAEGWLNEMLNELKSPAKFADLAPAQTFNGVLRPYQKRGFSWLYFLSNWGLGGCLADDMGLGKTIQTLALIQKRKEGCERNPVLLICPTSVVDNWRKESARFAPDLRVHVHHGGKRTKGVSFQQVAASHDIVISSYSLLDRDKQFLMDVAWSGVILDEAQNIKNHESKQARTASEISCGYKIALTGTPVENSVGDLWSIMNFLNPGLLGNQATFRDNFFEPIQFARDQAAKNKLQRIVQPFILRRLKTDKTIIDDLPDKQEMNVFCSLTKEQASLYRAVTKNLHDELSGVTSSGRSALVLSAMIRLKQICNHPALYLDDKFGLGGRSGKLSRLEEMLEEVLACRDKALIFSQFAGMGGMIKQYLEERFGQEVLFLHGGTNVRRRGEMVERFQSGEAPSLFVLSLKAGGTGLNLTAASHVFHFDRWWNPAVENQATDRAFRIGQRKNVQVHKLLCAGTLEEKIDALIRSKQELAENVIGAGEGWLTKLSNEELRNVFALSQEVFVE
jgi:SNF2 family DNA or RNA helicase